MSEDSLMLVQRLEGKKKKIVVSFKKKNPINFSCIVILWKYEVYMSLQTNVQE